MTAPLVLLSATSFVLATTTEGFQPPSLGIAARAANRSGPHANVPPRPARTAPPRSSTAFAAATGSDVATEESELTTSDVRTLFALLADDAVLFDPSRGTCCRNKCSGCTYLDSDGNFAYDEHSAQDEAGGWLAPYVKVDFGDRVHSSKWSTMLFPSNGDEKSKEVEKGDFASLLGDPDVSTLALQSLWNALSPSAGYPRLTATEVVRALKGIEGSAYDMGGAVGYDAFEACMRTAAAQIVQLGGVDGGEAEAIDYDAMTKEELLELVEERGMRTTFPKMKRIIVEELRFFDAHGRQGKRHPVKNTLS